MPEAAFAGLVVPSRLVEEGRLRRVKSFRNCSRLSAAAAVAIGAVVLAGWLLGIQFLMQALPGQVAMVPNAAVAFVLAGFALWWQAGVETSSRRYASGAAAATSGLIGLLSLIEYSADLNLGIDELLFTDRAGLTGVSPGRMAVLAAISFVALAGALLLSNSRRAPWAAGALAVISGSLALISLTGYAYGVRSLFWIGKYKGMAIHTAVAFLMLSVGVLLVRDSGLPRLLASDTTAGILARRILPTAFLVPLLLGRLGLIGQKAGLYGPDFEEAAVSVGDALLLVALFYVTAQRLRITDEARRIAEDELRLRNLLLSTHLDVLSDGVLVVNDKGRIILFNRRFAGILNVPENLLAVGTQWELWRTLARTDQYPARSDTSVRAHFDRCLSQE